MRSKRGRIDRFLAKHLQISLREIKLMIARGRVQVNGNVIDASQTLVDEFSLIQVDDKTLQDNTPLYIVLNKPAGFVCATEDATAATVLDLIDHQKKHDLHIVGRLDKNSTGLVLLTNDSRWSKSINAQEQKVAKRYLVSVVKPISEEMITAFAEGIYFATEQRHTKAAQLILLDECNAEVVLFEGMYHQIKRMFGHFRNPVISIHRIAIGAFELTDDIAESQWRELTSLESEQLLG